MATKTTTLGIAELQKTVLNTIVLAKSKEHGDGIKDGEILLSVLTKKLQETGIVFENPSELMYVLNHLLETSQIKVDSFCYDDTLNQQTVWIRKFNNEVMPHHLSL